MDSVSEFDPFIITPHHPLHRCRPLSKVWGRFLIASPDKGSAKLSSFVKEDGEEYGLCERQTRLSNYFEICKRRTTYICRQSRIDTINHCCSLRSQLHEYSLPVYTETMKTIMKTQTFEYAIQIGSIENATK